MQVKDPLLLDVPESIETERLLLRALRAGDGAALFKVLVESAEDLAQWLAWSAEIPDLETGRETSA